MPTQVNGNYNANFQKFVDFAKNAYATKGEDTVARFEGMPKGDHKGAFASFWRTSEMKTANDQVRDLFRKTVANMFGGEKFIPDVVRDNMKLEDFGKGKPLTARRISLVRTAIDTLGGDTAPKLLSLYAAIGDGKFNEGIDRPIAIRFEDQATSHMTHLGTLKDVIDLAADGRPGTGLAPFNGQLDPDDINGEDIYDDLLNIASASGVEGDVTDRSERHEMKTSAALTTTAMSATLSTNQLKEKRNKHERNDAR